MISEVYNMDCKKYMSTIPDNFFDLAIVDPPYGINATDMKMGSNPNRSKNDGYNSGPSISTIEKLKGRLNKGSGKLKNIILNKSNIDWDNEIPDAEYFKELFRVSKNQIIWGGNYFPLPPTRCFVIWNKCQPWDNFSQAEFAWTSFDYPAKLFTYSNTGGNHKEEKIHPTQKPIALYDYLYKIFAKPGYKIFDSHLGSGTNRVAADRNQLDFYACEKSEVHFNDQETFFKNNRVQSALPFKAIDNYQQSSFFV